MLSYLVGVVLAVSEAKLKTPPLSDVLSSVSVEMNQAVFLFMEALTAYDANMVDHAVEGFEQAVQLLIELEEKLKLINQVLDIEPIA